MWGGRKGGGIPGGKGRGGAPGGGGKRWGSIWGGGGRGGLCSPSSSSWRGGRGEEREPLLASGSEMVRSLLIKPLLPNVPQRERLAKIFILMTNQTKLEKKSARYFAFCEERKLGDCVVLARTYWLGSALGWCAAGRCPPC